MRHLVRCCLSLLFAAIAAHTNADDWPAFRGPTGQGHVAEPNLPLTWSATQNVAWSVDVPAAGWSSPIVWGDRVFLTGTTEGGVNCHVLCYTTADGKLLWDREVFRQEAGRKEDQNSYATPTPVTDGKHVYAVFAAGGIASVDFDGNVAWTNQSDVHFYSKHGLGASPILHDDLLIMPFDGSSPGPDLKVGWLIPWDGSFVLALDKATGKQRWRTTRGQSRQSHITPMIQTVDGHPQLLSAGGDVVQGMEPATGKILWWVKSRGEGVVPSFAYGDGLLFTSSGFEASTVRAIRPGGSGDVTASAIAWESRRNVPLLPSLTYADHLVFCLKETGICAALDAKTGDVVWQQRLEGKFSASPLVVGDKLYCLAEDGSTTALAIGHEFKQLAHNPLDTPGLFKASPAVSNAHLFIRGEKKLFCIK